MLAGQLEVVLDFVLRTAEGADVELRAVIPLQNVKGYAVVTVGDMNVSYLDAQKLLMAPAGYVPHMAGVDLVKSVSRPFFIFLL
jgi:hypothetical protein